MNRSLSALSLALFLVFTCSACSADAAGAGEVSIRLSGRGVTVDGRAAPSRPGTAVYVESGDAAVVTIARPGVYRVSGALTGGQLVVDLGEGDGGAETGITVILDGAELSCASGPALVFTRVPEGTPARLLLGDGTVSRLSTTWAAEAGDRGALCAHTALTLDAETAGGTCTLLLTSAGDGLAASKDLTLLGGSLHIDAQNDGVSVGADGGLLAVSGGVLTVSAGLSGAGDALSADGGLSVSGGELTLLSSGKALRAGGDVRIDGGTVTALGCAPSTVDRRTAQNTLSLSFAATQPTGARLTVRDTAGGVLRDYTAVRPFSDALISSPGLDRTHTWTVYVDGLQQQYSGGAGAMAFGSAAFSLPDGVGTYLGLTGFGTIPFADVSTDDTRYDSVRHVYGMGVMNGVSADTFAPDGPVDRAMAVTVLGRLAGEESTDTGAFSDVPHDVWYSDYVGWAVSAGIVQGDGEGHFLPGDAVTGVQMGLMLSRFARQAGWSYSAANTSREPLSRGELAGMLLDFSRVE